MVIKSKCMFLGKRVGNTKDGNEYKQLKFLDKVSNDIITVYCNDFGIYEKTQLYSDVDVAFNLYKDSKGFYRLSLGE